MTTNAPQATPTQTTAPQTTGAQPAEKATGEGGQVFHMHRAHPPLPYMTPGDLKASAQAMTSRLPGLPGRFPGRDVLFYGGLGALTVAGALEWPVALAIGGATYVLRGRARKDTGPRAQQTPTPGSTTPEGTKAD